MAVPAVVPVAVGEDPAAARAVGRRADGPRAVRACGARRSLWVGVYETGTVLRLDRAGRVRQRIRVGRYACRLAVTGDAVWVTRDNANAVVRIDRRTGRKRVARVSSPFDVVEAFGAIWVTSFDTGTVTRLHPRTARTLRVVRVGGNPAGVTRCGGRIWVGHGREATWLSAIERGDADARSGGRRLQGPAWPRCVQRAARG